MDGIRVQLELDDGSFTTRILHAGESLAQFQRNLGSAAVSVSKLNDSHRDFLGTLRDVTVVVGAARAAIMNLNSLTTGWVADIVKVNAEMERLTTLLMGMSKAAEPMKDAVQQVKYLRDFASQAPFSLDALTKSFTQLKASGIDPIAGSMKTLVDSVAGVGGSDAVLGRVTLAITQMSGKGVVSMEELRQQLGEAMPRAMELMARGMGVTMEELVKKVGTGTVSSKEAIAQMMGELDRVYGGAASAQMQTFNGIINALSSSWQNLAKTVGDTGFFENVKTGLRDLNTALSSNQADAYAKALGNGLSSAISIIRSGIGVVAQFKNEIVFLGEAMAIAFGAKLAMSGINTLISGIAGVGTAFQFSRLKVEAWRDAVLNVQTSPVPVQGAMVNLAASGTMAGNAFNFAATNAIRFGAVLTAVVPYLPILTAAVVAGWQAWQYYADRTKTAREEIEKFGAASRKAVADAYDPKIDQLTNRLKFLSEQGADLIDDPGSEGAALSRLLGGDSKARIEAVKKELEELKAARAKALGVGETNEGDAARRELQTKIDEQARIRSQAYDDESNKRYDAFRKQRDALRANNQDTSKIEAEYKADQKAAQLRFYDQQLEDLKKQKVEVDRILAEGSSADEKINRSRVGVLDANIARIIAQREAAEGTAMGTKTIKPGATLEDSLKTIQDAITRTKAAGEGLRAELAGAGGELEKLLYKLQNSDDIVKGSPQVEAMIEQLKEAIRTNEELQAQLKGSQDLNRDLLTASRKAAEDYWDATTQGMSNADKIAQRLKASGHGANPQVWEETKRQIQANTVAFGGVQQAVANFTNATREVGVTAAKSYDPKQNNLQQMVDMMGTAVAQANILRNAISGTAFGVSNAGGLGVGIGDKATGPVQQGASGKVSYTEKDLDYAIRTAIGEAGNQGSLGIQAVLSVIKNRAILGNQTLEQVATMNNGKTWQFEPWMPGTDARRKMEAIPTDSKKYQDVAAIARAVMEGAVGDPTNGATNFYAPVAQSNLGRNAPSWAGNDGQKIGGHVFYKRTYMGRNPSQLPEITNQAGGQSPEEALKDVAVVKGQELVAQAARMKAERDTLLQDMIEAGQIDQDMVDKMGPNLKKVLAQYQQQKKDSAKNGADVPDWNGEDFKKLRETAEAQDKLAQTKKDTLVQAKKNQTVEERIAQLKEDEAQRAKDALDKAKDPYSFTSNAGLQAKERVYRRELDKTDWDEDTKKKSLDEYMAGAKANQVRVQAADWSKENESLRQSLMTQEQMREQSLQNQIRLVDSYLEAYKQTGNAEVEVVRSMEERKALLRAKANQSSPLAKQMQEWSDIGNNIEKAATGWASSLADGIAQMVTKGKFDFASLAQSIIADIIKMGIQWSMSSLFKSFMGGMGGGSGAGASGGGLLSMLFGAAHTGGLVDAPPMGVRASPLAFMGAPRFHTGGIIKAMGIGPDEVPIIAKKGEGVFTPEQMEAMGSMGGGGLNQQVTIAPAITVNANGGTPAQNSDLAAQVGKQVEGMMRGVVIEEIRNQMRPNGLLRH